MDELSEIVCYSNFTKSVRTQADTRYVRMTYIYSLRLQKLECSVSVQTVRQAMGGQITYSYRLMPPLKFETNSATKIIPSVLFCSRVVICRQSLRQHRQISINVMDKTLESPTKYLPSSLQYFTAEFRPGHKDVRNF